MNDTTTIGKRIRTLSDSELGLRLRARREAAKRRALCVTCGVEYIPGSGRPTKCASCRAAELVRRCNGCGIALGLMKERRTYGPYKRRGPLCDECKRLRQCTECGKDFASGEKSQRLYCDSCRYDNTALRDRWKAKVRDAFWVSVNKAPGDGCWEWTRFTADGYGKVVYDGHSIGAHRLSYCMAHGIEPADMSSTTCVCHTCDHRRCVRPSHLFLGSIADNVADGVKKGRYLKAFSPTELRDFLTCVRQGLPIDRFRKRHRLSTLQYHADKAGIDHLLPSLPRPRSISQDSIDKATELRKIGYGYKRIAKALDIKRSTAKHIVRRYVDTA